MFVLHHYCKDTFTKLTRFLGVTQKLLLKIASNFNQVSHLPRVINSNFKDNIFHQKLFISLYFNEIWFVKSWYSWIINQKYNLNHGKANNLFMLKSKVFYIFKKWEYFCMSKGTHTTCLILCKVSILNLFVTTGDNSILTIMLPIHYMKLCMIL